MPRAESPLPDPAAAGEARAHVAQQQVVPSLSSSPDSWGGGCIEPHSINTFDKELGSSPRVDKGKPLFKTQPPPCPLLLQSSLWFSVKPFTFFSIPVVHLLS